MDDIPNPHVVFLNRLLLAERMSRSDPLMAIKELIGAAIEYHEGVQSYIAMLWREVCALRTERDLLSPYLTGEDWEELANELADLNG